jgi:hypothetical protein
MSDLSPLSGVEWKTSARKYFAFWFDQVTLGAMLPIVERSQSMDGTLA